MGELTAMAAGLGIAVSLSAIKKTLKRYANRK